MGESAVCAARNGLWLETFPRYGQWERNSAPETANPDARTSGFAECSRRFRRGNHRTPAIGPPGEQAGAKPLWALAKVSADVCHLFHWKPCRTQPRPTGYCRWAGLLFTR
jgi:hypothetical protein